MISTPRLRLVELRSGDADELFDAITPAVARFMAWELPASRSSLRARLESVAQDPAAGGINLVVRRLDDEACLGRTGIEDPLAECPEVGLWLRESAHGRGYGTEVVRALVGWAGVELGKAAFTYPVAIGNVASRRIAERLGGRVVASRSGPKYASVVYRIPAPCPSRTGSA